MNKLLVAAATAIALTVSACDFNSVVDAVDRFDLIIQLEDVETFAVGQVVDARTGELIDADFDVVVGGRDRSQIVDFYGDRVATVRARRGMFLIGVQPGVTPSESSPVRATLTVDAAGYEASTVNVRFNEVGERSLLMELLPQSAHVAGSASSSVTAAAGESVTVRADVGALNAEVAIASGALRRADGSAAQGSVTTRVRYHAPGSRALGALPAFQTADGDGFGAYGVISIDATEAGGSRLMATSGTARISIDPAAVGNLGVPFVNGDEIPVMAFDRDEGAWVEHGAAVYQDGAASFAIGFSSASKSSDNRPGPSQFVLAGTPEALAFMIHKGDHTSGGTMTFQSTGSVAMKWAVSLPRGAHPFSFSSSVVLPATLTFDLADGQRHEHHVEAGTSHVVVELPPARPHAADVLFELELSCTLKLRPPFNAALYYRPASGNSGNRSAGIPDWTVDAHGRVKGGSLTIPAMQIGERYLFTLVTPEETAWEELEITSEHMTYSAAVPGGFCAR